MITYILFVEYSSEHKSKFVILPDFKFKHIKTSKNRIHEIFRGCLSLVAYKRFKIYENEILEIIDHNGRIYEVDHEIYINERKKELEYIRKKLNKILTEYPEYSV